MNVTNKERSAANPKSKGNSQQKDSAEHERYAGVIEGLKRIAKRVGGDFSTVFKTITADNGSEF